MMWHITPPGRKTVFGVLENVAQDIFWNVLKDRS